VLILCKGDYELKAVEHEFDHVIGNSTDGIGGRERNK